MSPLGKLDKPLEPLHHLLDALEELRVRMLYCGKIEGDRKNPSKDCLSPIEMYHNVVIGSEWGRKCQYAIQSQKWFQDYDQEEILALILKVIDAIRLTDPTFAR
jgi:hypothetical protein